MSTLDNIANENPKHPEILRALRALHAAKPGITDFPVTVEILKRVPIPMDGQQRLINRLLPDAPNDDWVERVADEIHGNAAHRDAAIDAMSFAQNEVSLQNTIDALDGNSFEVDSYLALMRDLLS